MGIFDRLKGTKRPAAGVMPRPPGEVYAAVLAVNRPTAPFVVHDGRAEGVDLIAEWRIVDAAWYEIFARVGLTKVFRIFMRLDPATCEVRAMDQEWSVEWQAGVPQLSLSTERFRGQKTEISFGRAHAFTEQGTYGEVYNYHFSTGEMKKPLQEAVTRSGWTWRGVAFGDL